VPLARRGAVVDYLPLQAHRLKDVALPGRILAVSQGVASGTDIDAFVARSRLVYDFF
jgi:hypothetical protein